MAEIILNIQEEPAIEIDVNIEAPIILGATQAGIAIGPKGDSAYQVWLDEGNNGTEQEFLDSLEGTDGTDGITPHIGINNNWFIGNTDTGVLAQGTNGEDGENGVGIVSVTLTETNGLVKTYTILFTDNSTTTFNVTDGQDGEDADLSGHEQTYDHTLIASALQNISGQDLSQADNSISQFITADNVPTALSELSEDETHRTVTDVEKSTWNGKQEKMLLGDKYSSTDAGTIGQISLGDDYIYLCTQTGIAGNAIWKKSPLFISN